MRRPARLRRRRIIYRRACAPLRHVAPLGRTAHSVALCSRKRNGTPAATVRRSWLSCKSQNKCVPFANLRKMCGFAKFSTLNLHFASLNAPLRSQNIYIVAKFARCSRSSTLRRKMFNRSAYKHFSLLSHCRSSALPSKMSTYDCSFSRFAFAALLR